MLSGIHYAGVNQRLLFECRFSDWNLQTDSHVHEKEIFYAFLGNLNVKGQYKHGNRNRCTA